MGTLHYVTEHECMNVRQLYLAFIYSTYLSTKEVCSFTIVSCKRQLTDQYPQSVFQLLKYYNQQILSNISIHYSVLNVAGLACSDEKLLEQK